MTAQEAIRRIRDHNEVHSVRERNFAVYITEALNMAVEALEKQIPKKPRASFQSGFFWCPSCGRAIKRRIEDSKINISYCPFCGRALDWSDTDG